jgi:Ni/Co efflux regulator RcnB
MKKILTIATCLVFFMAVSAQSQHRNGINHRQHHQHTRIQRGISKGEITHHEAHRLRFEQRYIRKSEHCAKSDGQFTPYERASIQRMQNHSSRDIYRQKHDGQHRLKAL